MTVAQAIKEGYQHWMYSSDGFQPMRDLKELLGEDADFIWQREIELVDKDSYHPAGIDAGDLLEMIGDQLQEDHSGESGDDTDGVADAIKSIDRAIVQPLIDAITSKLEGLNYYRSTGITLTRNTGEIGTQDGEESEEEKHFGKNNKSLPGFGD